MYQIGTQLLHTTYGICTITDICKKDFTGSIKTYYVLHPVDESSDSHLYIPIESIESETRQLFSPAEVNEMILSSAKENIEWIDNNTMRKDLFSNILKIGNPTQVIAMICCIYKRKEFLIAHKRKLPTIDEKFLAKAQKNIHREFAYILNIKEEEVPPYMLKIISQKE